MVSQEEKWTTIMIPESLKEELKKLKKHRNQPYYEVIQELLDKVKMVK